MNILITGATSYIGKALSRELIARGHEVYGAIRPDSLRREGLPDKLHVIEAGLEDAAKLLTLDLPHIHVCIALAWGATTRTGRMDRAAQEHNAACTLKVMEAVSRLGCGRFIFAGSQAEYGVTLEKIEAGECSADKTTEHTVPRPVSEYGKSKLSVLREGRRLAAELGMTYIHLRIFSTYGPGDTKTSLVSACTGAFARNEHIVLSPCSQMWNYIYVGDCAAAIAGLSECPFALSGEDETEHVVNIASGVSLPLYEYVRLIHEAVPGGSYEHTRKDPPAEGTPWLDPDISRLRALTGFKEKTSFEEGIIKLAAEAVQ